MCVISINYCVLKLKCVCMCVTVSSMCLCRGCRHNYVCPVEKPPGERGQNNNKTLACMSSHDVVFCAEELSDFVKHWSVVGEQIIGMSSAVQCCHHFNLDETENKAE